MKKHIIALSLLIMAGLVYAESRNLSDTTSMISDASNATTSSTNYYGWAKVNVYTLATPSTSNSVWKIVRTKVDASGLLTEMKTAFNTNSVNDGALWSTAWTNRAAATYK